MSAAEITAPAVNATPLCSSVPGGGQGVDANVGEALAGIHSANPKSEA